MMLKRNTKLTAATLAGGAALALLGAAQPAFAQGGAQGGDLMSLDRGALRDEMIKRHDAAVALTRDPAVYAADNARFLWASQAKAQCGIAIGYLKSGYKDPISVHKCADAAERMMLAPPVMAAPPPPPPPASASPLCAQTIAGIVFFEFDSATVPDSADQTLNSVVQGVHDCAWTRLKVTGHTDRSGSDAYNQGLSVRRAQAVAQLLGSRGIDPSKLEVAGHGETEPKVPTADGVREPQNRRVEITVN